MILYFSLPEVSRSESPQFVVTLDGLDPSIFHAHPQTKQQTSVIMNSPNTDSESSAVEYEDSEVNRTEEVQRGKRPASPILYQKSSSPDATGILFFFLDLWIGMLVYHTKEETTFRTGKIGFCFSFWIWTYKFNSEIIALGV